jgi:hypothetical protein
VPENPLEYRRQVGPGGPDEWYRVTPEGKKLLQPVLDKYGVDASDLKVQFGRTPKGTAAFTYGDRITINRDYWKGASGLTRLELLAHEATHTAQYRELWTARFLVRYANEYFSRPDNYQWPGGPMPTSSIDTRFTLDQIATRAELEIRARYGP